MVNPVHQPPARIMPLYQGAIRQVMAERNIEPVQSPNHIVGADAGFDEVVRHTHWYVDLIDRQPHYRYRRYLEVLGRVKPGSRIAQIDIGCGAGLFSWAFLDWARENGLTCDRIDLYGLDHSPEMINLAQQVRAELMPVIPDYPVLRYAHDAEILLSELKAHHRESTDYIVTFGHVLVQAHSTQDIWKFIEVIFEAQTLGLPDTYPNCALLAVDALHWSAEFAEGWDLLLNDLAEVGIGHRIISVPTTQINDNTRAKIALLHPIR